MAVVNLFIDTVSGTLVASATSPTAVPAPSFNYGDTVTVNIYLLTRVYAVNNVSYTLASVPTNGLALELFLTDGTVAGGSTPYTSIITFTTDANNTYFIGTLLMNTTALQTLIGTLQITTAVMKIGYLQSAVPTTVYSGTVPIGVGIPTGAPVVPGSLTALSVEVAKQTFVPLQPTAGQPVYISSPAGHIFALQAVDNSDGTSSFLASQIS